MTIQEAALCMEIIGNVTSNEVKSSYRRLMLKWHPDRHSGSEAIEIATRQAQKLNSAYEIFSSYFEINEVYCSLREASADQSFVHSTGRWAGKTKPLRGKRFWNDVVEHGFPDPRVFEVFFFSSNLVSGGYNIAERILYQKFGGGSDRSVVYRYFNVPPEIWNGLLTASSHGRFAVSHINHSFRYERCHEPNRPYDPFWRLL
jgi:hypothetical protein